MALFTCFTSSTVFTFSTSCAFTTSGTCYAFTTSGTCGTSCTGSTITPIVTAISSWSRRASWPSISIKTMFSWFTWSTINTIDSIQSPFSPLSACSIDTIFAWSAGLTVFAVSALSASSTMIISVTARFIRRTTIFFIITTSWRMIIRIIFITGITIGFWHIIKYYYISIIHNIKNTKIIFAYITVYAVKKIRI